LVLEAGGAVIAEIVTIGNEVLSGRTLDTNFAFLARLLEESGARVAHHQTVADVPETIAAALQAALKRARVVVATGGLGPTPDDVTRKGVSLALGRPLSLDPAILERLRARWEARGGRMPMPANNELQALVPRGAQVLENPVGSAPALLVELEEQGLFVLPGVPAEMEAIARASVAPWVTARSARPVEYLTLRTTGIWESVLAERVGDVSAALPGSALAYLPGLSGVDVRVALPAGEGADPAGARAAARALLAERIGPYLYAEGEDTLEAVVGRLLEERGYTIAVAESCTGGLLAGRITAVAGSSRYFESGVVCYSNAAKVRLVGVRAALIDEHGAVSESVARALAAGIARKRGTQVGIGVTGIAGPGGGTPEKPVGTVHVAALAPEGERHRQLALAGSRANIRGRSAVAALELVRRLLLGIPDTPRTG
jgi:nicotinamide-nucleotide amidase